MRAAAALLIAIAAAACATPPQVRKLWRLVDRAGIRSYTKRKPLLGPAEMLRSDP